MKRIIKGIFLFVVIALSLVFAYPLNTYALTEQTSYVSIDNTQNLKVGSLSFSSISFRNYSSTSTQAFGLTGELLIDLAILLVILQQLIIMIQTII